MAEESEQISPSKKRKKEILKKLKIDKIQEASTAKVLNRVKSENEIQLLFSVINSIFILTNLDEPCKRLIINSMKSFSLDPKQLVYEQGHPGECFYIVSSGRLEVLINTTRVSTLKPGDSFGELALIDDQARTNSVRSLERTVLWGIDRNTYKSTIESYSSVVFKETLEFISSVPIFESLSSEQRQSLVSAFTMQTFEKDEKIINEGEPGDTLHIIKNGEVNVLHNQIVIRKMGRGSFYGEQALINNCTRTASIYSVGDSTIMIIKRESLVEVLGTGLEEIIFRNALKLSLGKSQMLKDLSSLPQIIDVMKIVKYNAGQTVIKKDTRKGTKLLVVVRGKLQLPGEVFELYDIIGESDMKRNSKERFSDNLLAEVDSVVAEILKKKLEKCMDTKISQFSDVNDLLKVLKKVNLFRYMTNEKLKLFIKVMGEQSFVDGENIINQGEIGDKLYIIKKGSVSITKNGEVVRTLYTDNFFGERAVVFNEARSATVMALGPVECWVLKKSDFSSIVDEKMHRALMKRIELQDDTITLNDLLPIKILGKGMYGNVFLCIHKEKKSLYALKSVTRQKIAAYEIYENMLLEKNILMTLDHLMIVKLVRTFKDNLRVYFLMEFIKGIDLFELQCKVRVFNPDDVKFYVEILILIVEFLHRHDIIYRDLKPENVIVDDEGYLKLIDFGSAKIVKGKTYTTVGSPHYMAPEVMIGTGYSTSVDWWSLGIIMYELLEGNVPFGSDDDDPAAVYKAVMEHNLVFINITNVETQEFIKRLLNSKPAIRNLGNTEKLKAHPYFRDARWEQIMSRQVRPRFIPKIADLTAETARAQITRKPLRDFINREETKDVIYRHNSNPVANYLWDVNF